MLALAAMTCVGLPLRVFQDVLRGSQRFLASALAEAIAFVIVGVALVVAALAAAPLWILVLLGASIPFATGACAGAIVALSAAPYRYRPTGLASTRRFLTLSSYLFLMGVSDLIAYSLDRTILGAFRSTAAVGSCDEGPIRAHNLIRQLHGTLAVHGPDRRLADCWPNAMWCGHADLLLRGTRYTLAAVVPVTIVVMVLAKPILDRMDRPEVQRRGDGDDAARRILAFQREHRGRRNACLRRPAGFAGSPCMPSPLPSSTSCFPWR